MTRELTVAAFARREQVSTRTLRRWLKQGRVEGRKTHGGHWRILVEEPDDNDGPKPTANAGR
jgi:excisionase family DNA binding protein